MSSGDHYSDTYISFPTAPSSPATATVTLDYVAEPYRIRSRKDQTNSKLFMQYKKLVIHI